MSESPQDIQAPRDLQAPQDILEVAYHGETAVMTLNNPRRLNAFAGSDLSNSPTAAAVCASGSRGAARAASANCRRADSGFPSRCSDAP